MTEFPLKLISEFDDEVARLMNSPLSFTQEDVFKTSLWAMGEDALLREDFRFRQTPWKRWMLYDQILANELLHRHFQDISCPEVVLKQTLKELTNTFGGKLIFCPGDPRFIMNGKHLRLAASELSPHPLIQDELSNFEKFQSHLPVTTLEAAAASEPSGDWGPEAMENSVQQLGWMRINLAGRKLNDRMFIAKIKGHSMNNGRNGLINGAFAVFELWPVGTRQNKTVLVRGAFTDPETGSYAVKKYMADVRDTEGRHNRVTLVSLNPDKTLYPDIEVLPEQDDDISIVAQLISPLDSGQFARKPKTRAKPGRRDLTSEFGLSKIKKRLGLVAAKFFDNETTCRSEKTNGDPEGWNAHFICLDHESHGLHIQTTPLTGLPSFAKKISVSWGDEKTMVLASNLKNRPWQIAVPPSDKPYVWSAPGHEEMLDEDLELLNLKGLSLDEPLLFRVDTAGIGHQISGKKLSFGNQYRLIVPPGLSGFTSSLGEKHTLLEGWVFWEFEILAAPGLDLQALFDKLGLSIAKQAPLVQWALQTPTGYKKNYQGVSYACFSPDALPVLIIHGLSTALAGEVNIFIFSGKDLISLPLPPGDKWHISLESLSPGNYMVEVVHERNRFGRSRLPFCIQETSVNSVSSVCMIRFGKKEIKLGDKNKVSKVDLSRFVHDEQELQIYTPPLWPLVQKWQDEVPKPMKKIYADGDGTLKLEAISEDISRYSEQPVGDYILDFRELGEFIFQHTRRPSTSHLFNNFQIIVEERHDMLKAMPGQFEAIINLWLEPILKYMNYSIAKLPLDGLDMPGGCTALLLNTMKRKKHKIVKQKQAILILLTHDPEKELVVDDMMHGVADALCETHELNSAIITDAFSWSRHKAESRLTGKIRNMTNIVKNNDAEDFEQFLYEFSVGL